MRKPIIGIIISLASVLLLMPSQINAADMSIGATVWYTAWDFEMQDNGNVEYDPGFLYGPVLSLGLTQDFNLSLVFLYGRFDQIIDSDKTKIDRYDSDLALNYRIGNYLKLFAGAKYIKFTYDPVGKHQAIGPGVGVSSVLPLAGNLFLLGNISGLYLFGKEKNEGDESKVKEYGANASLSIAYYIPFASTTISIGGRLQQVTIEYEKDSDYFSKNTSRFYGVTLSAIYSFSI